jgi:hypothetical protein
MIKALIQISNSLQCYACELCNDLFNIYKVPIFDLPDNDDYNCAINRMINFSFVDEFYYRKMFGMSRDVTKLCNLNNTDQYCC